MTEVDERFIQAMNDYRVPKNTNTGLIQISSENIVIFAERMLGLKLYSWQVKFLHDIQEAIELRKEGIIHGHAVKLPEYAAITSRQIGKSTALAVLGLWCAVFNKCPGTLSFNTSMIIISASDVQAKKLLHEIKKFILIGDGFMERTYRDTEGKPMFGKRFFSDLIDDGQDNNKTTITFKIYNERVHGDYLLHKSKTGSTIKSYPPTSVVLGETATIQAIDEVGKSDRISDQFIYDYFDPIGNSTNALKLYTSTPWTSSGFFYRIVDPDEIYQQSSVKVVTYTIDAIKIENPSYYYLVKKKIDELNRDGKTDEVQRAYYCRFVKGEQAYFNPEKVNSCFTPDQEKIESYNGECDMGVDFGGQVKSKTVITISTKIDNKVIRLYHYAYEVGKDRTLIEDIAELLKRFNVQRIIPDDCPAGAFLIQTMIEKGWNVHPMNFRKEKVKKYGAFRAALNRGDIWSYMDDDLRTEMMAMEFSQGAKNSVLQHAPGYSDDLIDSFVMSCYFYISEESTFKIYTWEDE